MATGGTKRVLVSCDIELSFLKQAFIVVVVTGVFKAVGVVFVYVSKDTSIGVVYSVLLLSLFKFVAVVTGVVRVVNIDLIYVSIGAV